MIQKDNLQVLERSDFMKFAPSFYAETPKSDVSDRYSFVSSYEIAKSLWSLGWFPTFAREANSRKSDNKGFMRHIVRFSHKDFAVNGERVETVLVNSHNRSSAVKLYLGVFRLVCSNGMISQTSDFGNFSIKHMGSIQEQINTGINQIANHGSNVVSQIDNFKTIDLTENEQGVFASAVHSYLYPDQNEITPQIEPKQLLTIRRDTDNRSDLWTVFNRVQENTLKGGIPTSYKYKSEKWSEGKRKVARRTRQVKDISKDVKLNQALWTMASEFSKLKNG